MKSEDRDRKQDAALDEDELNAVTGGQTVYPDPASTMQYRPDVPMDAFTMEFKPGASPMEARTAEQRARGARPANPANQPKNPGGAHSL